MTGSGSLVGDAMEVIAGDVEGAHALRQSIPDERSIYGRVDESGFIAMASFARGM